MKSFIITKVYNCLVLRFFFLFFSPKCEHIIEKRFWHAFPTNAYLANASKLCQQTAFIHSRWRKKVSLNVERVFSELKSVFFQNQKEEKKQKKNLKEESMMQPWFSLPVYTTTTTTKFASSVWKQQSVYMHLVGSAWKKTHKISTSYK